MTQAAVLAQMGNTNQTFRNRIINGAMGIWQRGTSAALSNSYSYLTADRWETDMGSTAAATASQSTSVPTATTQYSLKLQRTASSTSTGNIVAAQALETANSYDLAGSSITLSFWAKCGVNYSATSSILSSFVFFGTGTDQSMSSMRSNAWTGQTNVSQNNTVSTTWTKFSQTVSCPAGTTQVGMQFVFSPTGTAGADDSVYITGVQLEAGTTATPFEMRSYGTELALCQRYLPAYAGPGGTEMLMYGTQYNNTTNCYVYANFPVTTRVAPTGITVSSASHFRFAGTVANMTMSAMAFSGSSTMGGEIALTGTGGSSLQGGSLQSVNAAALVYFTGCEL